LLFRFTLKGEYTKLTSRYWESLAGIKRMVEENGGQTVILMPGDSIVIRPCTQHAVITVYKQGTAKLDQWAIITGQACVFRNDLVPIVDSFWLRNGGRWKTGQFCIDAATKCLPLFRMWFPSFNFPELDQPKTALTKKQREQLTIEALIKLAVEFGNRDPTRTYMWGDNTGLHLVKEGGRKRRRRAN
jgi:hypothetical protein